MADVPLLDHIVILVPHAFLGAPPRWLTDVFTFIPGGQHAGGATENALALLPDGSYLEFIAFVPGGDPAGRAGHKWGRLREGTVVDWAVTLNVRGEGEGEGEQKKKKTQDVDEATRVAFARFQQRVQSATGGSLGYADLTPGGRRTPQGREIKWALSSATRGQGSQQGLEPGKLPFWCLDDTPRGWRVPYRGDDGGAPATRHPAGILGVAAVSVTPRDEGEARQLEKAYGALLGSGGDDAGAAEEEGDDSLWELRTFEAVHPGGQLRLEAPSGGEDGGSLLSIAFYTRSKEFAGKKVGGEVADGVTLEFELVAAE
ncbi:glyoxalase-like domain-containing protein [Xylariales sp. PMI_506]|nr:glyoxalase-like domain-containing protein [Xylariales sp. PMI_506]